MSTKTSIKRLALVAVSALGFGVMTAIAPASAAVTSLTAGTPSAARPGALSKVTITPTMSAGATFTATARVTSAPTGSALTTATFTNLTGVNFEAATGGATLNGNTSYAVAGSASRAMTAASTTATAFGLTFRPDVAGTYTILVSTNANNAGFVAGDPSVVVTVTTVGAPASITLASVAGSVVDFGVNGQLFSMSLKDANGNATVIGQSEAITLTDGDATTALAGLAQTSADGVASLSFGIDNPNLVGSTYYFRVVDAGTIAAGSAVVTATGSGLLPATLTTNITATKVAATELPGTATATFACTTAANCVANGNTSTFGVKGAVSVTVGGLSGSTAADVVHAIAVRNGSGLIYDSALTIAKAATAGNSATFTIPAPTSASLTTVRLQAAGEEATWAYVAPVATSLVVQGQNSVLSATGGTNRFTVLARDQYTGAMANVAVSAAVAGRNTVATTVVGVSDANGLVSYSWKDAGTIGTVDTLTFSGAGTATATVTYGTVTVATVTVSGGSKAETVAGSTLTPISAGDNGPAATFKEIKAVVKDASGNLLAGVPVTFSVSSGAIVKTAAIDYATVYTLSDGSATTRVFDWKSGKQTITATAGGISGTDYFTWAATDATSARTLAGKADGNILSYTVTDRFGNPVSGVAISLSRTGSGLFGNGASTQTITTDSLGTADASFNGSGTVVAELATTTQAYDAAGQIFATAATAAVAGTTTGTGNTFTPAGVGKVSLTVAAGSDAASVAAAAAADAALEAIDAANAATDAANLAAEAADAATVAAEEARDAADAATAAVEALASEVATLIASLKAQITTLANTVAKIAKRVRA